MRVAEDEPFHTHDGSPSLADRLAGSGAAVAIAKFLSDHVGRSARRGLQVALMLMAILAVTFAYRTGNPSEGALQMAEPALLGGAVESAAGPILESRRGEFGSFDSGSDDSSGPNPNESIEPNPLAYDDTGSLEVRSAARSASSTPTRPGTTPTTGSHNLVGPSTTAAVSSSGRPASTTSATTRTSSTPAPAPAPASTTTTTAPKRSTTTRPPSTTSPKTTRRSSSTTTTAPPTTSPPVGPSAVGDSATTEEEESVTVKVLANDVAGDGALVPSTLRIVSGPRHAESVTVTGSHKIRYEAREWEGTDQLTYEVCDTNNLCDTATLTIRVEDD